MTPRSGARTAVASARGKCVRVVSRRRGERHRQSSRSEIAVGQCLVQPTDTRRHMAVSIQQQQQVAVNIQLLFPMRSREYYIRLLIPITYAIQNCSS